MSRTKEPVSGLSRTATTDNAGRFVFRNLPPNPYHLHVEAQGFNPLERDVDVRSGVPIEIELKLALAGTTETVQVTGHVEDLLERDPTEHNDIDQSLIAKLPIESARTLLNRPSFHPSNACPCISIVAAFQMKVTPLPRRS